MRNALSDGFALLSACAMPCVLYRVISAASPSRRHREVVASNAMTIWLLGWRTVRWTRASGACGAWCGSVPCCSIVFIDDDDAGAGVLH